jgi:hypothetical protein
MQRCGEVIVIASSGNGMIRVVVSEERICRPASAEMSPAATAITMTDHERRP